jgi:hypothetical protein
MQAGRSGERYYLLHKETIAMKIRHLMMVVLTMAITLGLAPAGWATGFDMDGSPDLVFTVNYGTAGQVIWYENVAGTVVVRDIVPYCDSTYDTIAFCNLDGDQYPDLLVGGSNNLRWYEARHKDTVNFVQEWNETGANFHDIQNVNGKVYIARKGVVGKLVSTADNVASWVSIEENGLKDFRTINGGDWDNDGKTELIVGWNWVATPSSGQTDLFEDDGTTIGWKNTFSYAVGGDEFCAGDFDGDGNMDLFVSTPGQFDWFEANGTDNGVDWRGTIIARKAIHMIMTDWDNDGKTDLLTSEVNNGEATSWYEATGDNGIAWITNLNNYHRSGILCAGDWDKDGAMDVFYGSKPGTYGIWRGEINTGDWAALADYTYNGTDAAFYPGNNDPEPVLSQNMNFDVPAIGTIAIDGNLGDWSASTAWSAPYIWWNGNDLTSTTKAKFAWNNAQDLLYVAVETNEASVQPGGHLVIGISKEIGGNPFSGNGATQLCFDIQGATVQARNEINLTNQTGDLATDVQAAYSVSGGVYTFEVAIPFWSNWKETTLANRQTLSLGEKVYVYSCMESAFRSENGTNLTWYGNPKFYLGAFDKGAELKLVAGPLTPGDANGDGMVDVGDLGILAANYGGSNKTWELGDFNGDKLVDVGDLGILAAHYGEGATQQSSFAADYAKAFGSTVADDTQDDASVCSTLGLPLIAGLLLAGLMLVKLEE